ncbi:MAG: hypothetical protein ABR941_02430 [Thermoleophilia bacterium]
MTLGFLALAAAGVALISAAIELLAAAVGRRVVVWRAVPLPHSHEGRMLVVLVLLAGSVALAALALRARPAPLVLSVEGGSLRLPPDTLERYLADELARDPDVVSSRASFALRDERLAAELWVALRPLAPAAVLRERLGGVATAALRDGLGLAADVDDPVVRVLRVHELPRYLR